MRDGMSIEKMETSLVLDHARDGVEVPASEVTQALSILGDIEPMTRLMDRPLCFIDAKEYKEWRRFAILARTACSPCTDCTADFQAKMSRLRLCDPKETKEYFGIRFGKKRRG